MSWSDLLMGRGALKKAAATGDTPKPAQAPPARQSTNHVEQEIARQRKVQPGDPGTGAPPVDKKKKQPRIGFRPDETDDK